jgi:hypothetical protein
MAASKKGRGKAVGGRKAELDNLKNKSSSGAKRHGGRRAGSGRPEGSKNRATLERQAVADAFNQRVMQKADALFNAQLSLAVGSARVFRVDEEGEGKNKKRVHTLVTSEDEIKTLLDEHDGGAGVVDGVFYYITTVQPDNRALDSLLNRALGKPKETHEHSGPEGQPIPISIIEPVKPS